MSPGSGSPLSAAALAAGGRRCAFPGWGTQRLFPAREAPGRAGPGGPGRGEARGCPATCRLQGLRAGRGHSPHPGLQPGLRGRDQRCPSARAPRRRPPRPPRPAWGRAGSPGAPCNPARVCPACGAAQLPRAEALGQEVAWNGRDMVCPGLRGSGGVEC